MKMCLTPHFGLQVRYVHWDVRKRRDADLNQTNIHTTSCGSLPLKSPGQFCESISIDEPKFIDKQYQ